LTLASIRPPYRPATRAGVPDSAAVSSHIDSASCSAAFAIAKVAAADCGFFGFATPGAGIDATGSTNGFSAGHEDGTGPPRIHERTAFTAQPDGSAVTVLWPTLGTTSRCPCGNCAVTAAAPASGVRRSSPPVTPSIGTFGNVVPNVTPPSGPGQPVQKSALPNWDAHEPNGPNVPAGAAVIAVWSSAGRSAGAVSGAQGNGPSRQTVAA